MKNWKEWCRLCANTNFKNEYFIHTNLELLNILHTNFQFVINENDGKPNKLCDLCYQFLNMINIFKERCIKIELMYTQFLCISNLNVNRIRKKFIDDEHFNILNYTTENFTNLDGENEMLDRNNKTEQLTFVSDNENGNSNEIKTEIEVDDFDTDRQLSVSTISTKKERKKKNYDGFFKCEFCDQTFTKSYSYKTHIKSKHTEPSFFCSKCPKSYTTRYLLNLHEKVHLPVELKQIHPCNECGKKFSKVTNLKIHIKTVHYNERSFVCDECGKGFKLKCALQEHQITHSDEKLFQCTVCPKSFKSLSRLKVHYDLHTDTTYPCPKCSTVCRTRNLLQGHMDVHKEEKSHKCEYCGNVYKRYKALKRHSLSSHIGYNISCKYCKKKFISDQNCMIHQRSAHPEHIDQLDVKIN